MFGGEFAQSGYTLLSHLRSRFHYFMFEIGFGFDCLFLGLQLLLSLYLVLLVHPIHLITFDSTLLLFVVLKVLPRDNSWGDLLFLRQVRQKYIFSENFVSDSKLIKENLSLVLDNCIFSRVHLPSVQNS